MLIWQWDGAYLVLCISIYIYIYINLELLYLMIILSFQRSRMMAQHLLFACVCLTEDDFRDLLLLAFFLFFACASCWSIVSLSVHSYICVSQTSKQATSMSIFGRIFGTKHLFDFLTICHFWLSETVFLQQRLKFRARISFDDVC